MSDNGTEKKKIAMYWAASCGGCDISLLEIGPRILDLIEIADVVFWPCAADFKYQNVVDYADDYIDYCFFNGSIRNSEQQRIASLLRKKSKTLVAYGSCACDGGIPALANFHGKDEIYRTVYLENPSTDNSENVIPVTHHPVDVGELEIPELYDNVLTLADVVDVDYLLPGCPPQADRVWEAIQALVSGAVPEQGEGLRVGCGDRSVCDECSREKKIVKIRELHRPHEVRPEPEWCLLEQGIICLGPATRSGCGALCVDAGLPCRGCYGVTGDVEDQAAAMIGAMGTMLDAETEEKARELIEEIVDPVGTFCRFTLSSGHLKGSK